MRKWILFLSLALLALPAVAEDTVYQGADLWVTAGAGSTHSSFKDDPLPADFFCPGSTPVDGVIQLEGKPLVTEPPGFLGNVDTVVRRLDDATFDENGVATTRIRLEALSLVSAEPIEVGCEQPFDVAVSLNGDQPETEMKIYRTNEEGGTFVAPLALKVKVAFTPVGGGDPLVVLRDIKLGPGSKSIWSYTARLGTTVDGKPVLLDTDGDSVADSTLPDLSNFLAGVLPAAVTSIKPRPIACPINYCPYESCHCNPDSEDPFEEGEGCSEDHLHCTWVCVHKSQFPGGLCPAVAMTL